MNATIHSRTLSTLYDLSEVPSRAVSRLPIKERLKSLGIDCPQIDCQDYYVSVSTAGCRKDQIIVTVRQLPKDLRLKTEG